MYKRTIIISLVAVSLLAVACGDASELFSSGTTPQEQVATVPLAVNLQVAKEPTMSVAIGSNDKAQTKAAGVPLDNWALTKNVNSYYNRVTNVGLHIVESTGPDHINSEVFTGYNNIELRVTPQHSNDPQLTYHIGSKGYQSISVPRQDELGVYSYIPFTEGATDISAIPFTSGMRDYMIAPCQALNGLSGLVDNKAVLNLEFYHLMTCIQIKLRPKFPSAVRLETITLVDKLAGVSPEKLYSGGTINAQAFELADADTPEQLQARLGIHSALNEAGLLCVDPESLTDRITVPIDEVLKDSMNYFYICFPPVNGIRSGQFELEFKFEGQETPQLYSIAPNWTSSGLDGEGQSVWDMERSKRCLIELVLDNTMRFINSGIDYTWIEVTPENCVDDEVIFDI